MKKLGILFIALVGFGISSFGQASATATAAGTIVQPITIAQSANMNFGNIAVSASTAGTVIMTPAGVRSTGGAGGVTLPATLGTVGAAAFTVGGAAGYTYAITLPVTHTIKHATDADVMTVNAFTSTPSGTGTLSGGGSQTVNVGATLNVDAAQKPGVYTSTSGFQVTVNYN